MKRTQTNKHLDQSRVLSLAITSFVSLFFSLFYLSTITVSCQCNIFTTTNREIANVHARHNRNNQEMSPRLSRQHIKQSRARNPDHWPCYLLLLRRNCFLGLDYFIITYRLLQLFKSLSKMFTDKKIPRNTTTTTYPFNASYHCFLLSPVFLYQSQTVLLFYPIFCLLSYSYFFFK